MLRKAGIATALLLALPAFANAWTLTAKIGSGQGSITAAKGGTTVAFGTYSGGANYSLTKSGAPVVAYFKSGVETQTVNVAPGANNAISAVYVDGVKVSVPATGGDVAVNGTKAGAVKASNHSMIVYCSSVAAGSLTVTAPAGGSIAVQHLTGDPAAGGKPTGAYSRTGFDAVKVGSWVRVYALPNGDYKVAAANGFAAGDAGEVKYKDIQIVAGVNNVTASFGLVPAVAARLSADYLSVATGATVNLDATKSSANGALSYSYSVSPTAGASLVASGATATATFSAPGTYVVTLTATSGGVSKDATATIRVAAGGTAASGTCTSCHANRNAALVISYNKAAHSQSAYSACASCHTTTMGAVTTRTVSASTFKTMTTNVAGLATTGALYCTKCHNGQYQSTSETLYPTTGHGTNGHGPKCGTCHSDIHYPEIAHQACGTNGACHNGVSKYAAPKHFSNISASYVSKPGNVKCDGCHFNFDPHNLGGAQTAAFLTNTTAMTTWAEGGHADTNAGAWKISASHKWDTTGAVNGDEQNAGARGCIRCHNGAGFMTWIGANGGTPFTANPSIATVSNNANGTVLGCYGCHESYSGTVRDLPAVTVYYNYSSKNAGFKGTVRNIAVSYPDAGPSNLCISCHSGRQGGATYDALIAKFGNLSGSALAIGPHDATAAVTLFRKGAAVLNTAHDHEKIGINDYKGTGNSGPCAACHNMSAADHTFEAVKADGTIANADLCNKCHSGLTVATIDKAKEELNNAVLVAAQVIANSTGIYPTLATAADGSKEFDRNSFPAALAIKLNNAKLVQTLNAQMLKMDAGSFAHNPAYTRKLVADIVDAFDDGQLNGTAAATINALTAITGVVDVATVKAETASWLTISERHVNTSSATYKVQYVLNNSQVVCATCHNPAENTLQAEARKAWAESGHGETTALPWIPASNHLWRSAGFNASYADAASGSDCVRCHTAEGFAQFVGGATPFTNVKAVASAADAATNSPLACNTCHTNGLTNDSERITVPQVTVYYNISTVGVQKTHLAATYPVNLGESNMCIPCHAGRVSGAALADAASKGMNFTTNSFQNSHYMAAAGLMYVKAGFTAFTTASTVIPGATDSYGQSLTSDADTTVNTAGTSVAGKLGSTHRKLGTTAINGDTHNAAFFVAGNLDTNGPCVTCHLQGYTIAGDKRPGAGHSLGIDAAAWTQVCNNCHSSEGILMIEEQKAPYDAMMNVLKNLVQTKLNTEYDPAAYPYFFKAGLPHTNANAFKAFGNVKNEGAAFNLNLLTREPAAYIHARTYVRRLIYDSIDYLDDGQMNLSVKSYLEGLGTFGARPADATGTTANDAVWQYIQKYDRTTKAWNATSERP